MAMTFIDPRYKDTLTVVPRVAVPHAAGPCTNYAVGVVRIITTDGSGKSPGNHVIDLSLSDIERIRDALTARLESANADA
jgi:hypothetical protein